MYQNVLITSAGRRGKLVAAFRRELSQRLPSARVLGADVCPELSAGCRIADAAYAVPRANDPRYVPQLLAICRQHQVGLVVPTIDPELPVLAEARRALSEVGTHVAVSDPEFASICRDKRRLTCWFSEHGLETPQVFPVDSIPSFPVFVKPFAGSGSEGARVLECPKDLTDSLRADGRMMYVQYLPPDQYEEYTFDLYYDRLGQLRCVVPRLRLETRAGEVSKARIKRVAAMNVLRERLQVLHGVRGCITLQAMVHRRTFEILAIEINPRFGGGFPLSYEAGANFPGWLISEYLLDRPIGYFDGWEDELTMLRYDDHVLVRDSVA